MRIGLDAKRAFYNNTGLGNYSRTLISALRSDEADFDLYCYTPGIPKDSRAVLQETDTYHIRQPNTAFNKLFKSYWRSKGIVSDLKRDGIQLFHGLSAEIPAGLKEHDIRSVVTIHDLIFKRFPNTYPLIDRLIYDRKSRFAFENSDKIIAISEQTKKDIIEYYGIDPDKIHVIIQDVDPQFKQQLSPAEKADVKRKYKLPDRFALYVGSFSERKNVKFLLETWAQAELDDWKLILVGQGSLKYVKQMDRIIDRKKLEDKIDFLPQVGFSELPALYQMADFTLYPSRYEGYGLPIAESLHSGTPVLINDIPCFSAFVQKGVVKLQAEDKIAWAQKIHDMAKEHFSIEIEAPSIPDPLEQLLEVYRELI